MVPITSSQLSVAMTRSICRQWQKRATLPSSRLRSASAAASKPASSPKRSMRSEASASASRPWINTLSMVAVYPLGCFGTADKCRQRLVDHVRTQLIQGINGYEHWIGVPFRLCHGREHAKHSKSRGLLPHHLHPCRLSARPRHRKSDEGRADRDWDRNRTRPDNLDDRPPTQPFLEDPPPRPDHASDRLDVP